MAAKSHLPKGRAFRYTKDEIEEALKSANGNVSEAARRLGCARRTVARYIERYPDLEDVRSEALEGLKDLAENELTKKIKEGNMTAIIFFLKCRAKERGWIDRQVVEHTGSIEHKTGAEDVKPEELDAVIGNALGAPTNREPEPQG